MSGTGTAELIAALSLLEGDAFEEAVVGHLSRAIDDFQPIPRKGGDGGLDGLSQNGSVAHCCYGPQEARLATALDKKLRRKIVEKFRDDLRRLFELEPRSKPKRRLVHAANAVLAGVIGATRKITRIRLHLNRFDDNALIGELNDALAECKAASQHRFVDPACALTIWGPKQLSDHVPASEETLFRLRQPTLAAVLASTANATQPPPTDALGMFDVKFDDLRARHPRPAAVEEARAGMREHWTAALAFDQKLAEVAPSIHQDLERTRESAATTAERRKLAPGALDPFAEMEAARTALVEALQNRIPDAARRDVIAEGEVARLIGDCAIDWRETP